MFDLMKYAASPALIEEERTYTYKDLFEESERIAAAIGQRTVCFLLTSNTFASIAGYAACLNHRIVPVMIDGAQHADLLREVLAAYRPSFLWIPENRLADFVRETPGDVASADSANSAAAAESAPLCGSVADGSCAPEKAPLADGTTDYDAVYKSNGYILLKSVFPCPFALYDELALLMTTSGSTGSPKLVRQSYRNLRSNTESIIDCLGITEDERAITSLPMNYVYGLSVVNTHLYAGAALVLTRFNAYSPKFWKLFNEKGATSFAGVPFIYEMLLRLHVLTTRQLPTLRTMTQAGGKLSPELHEIFAEYAAEHHVNFVVMYGASEATARMGYLPPEMAVEKKGSMGIVIPGGRFELLGADGRVIEGTDEVGELIYYGDNVTLGYAKKGEDLALGDENRGRLATGDMAKRDGDGCYYIVGRKKRFVKLRGRRLSLDELERNLKTEFGTIDIACAGKDDLLKVYLTNESLKEAAAGYIFGKLGVSRRLFQIVILPEIPKNASGKPLYSQL